ncbi:MAG: hypothetical protein WA324_02445 [Bryobacteraceae bacterium]
MRDASKLIRPRLAAASRAAEEWLTAIDPNHLDTATLALHGLAKALCSVHSRSRIITAVERNRTTKPLRCSSLVSMSRNKLLRTLNSIAIHPRPFLMDSPSVAGRVVGALGLSYSWSDDVTVVASIVRAAGRLRLQDGFLNQCCLYLLNQQSASGAFGLLACGDGQSEFEHAIIRAHLKATVDIIWALAAYQAGEAVVA